MACTVQQRRQSERAWNEEAGRSGAGRLSSRQGVCQATVGHEVQHAGGARGVRWGRMRVVGRNGSGRQESFIRSEYQNCGAYPGGPGGTAAKGGAVARHMPAGRARSWLRLP